MNKAEFISYWSGKLKPWADLQFMLSDISSIDDEKKNDFNKLIPPFFYSTKKDLVMFLQLIQGFLINENNNLYFYFAILEFLIPKIKEFLTSYEIYKIFHKTFNHILLWFYDHKLLDIDTIIDVSKNNYDIFEYFIYDIKEYDEKAYKKIYDMHSSLIHYHPIETFNQNREARINETRIAKIIRNDDINEFQNIISLTNLDINSKIQFSLFESCFAVNYLRCMPSLIEFASFFGSIKIFKYLLMQDAKINSGIWEYAIHGNNFDIIHLIENKNIEPFDCVVNAICYYRYDLFEYFTESQDFKITINCINRAILNFNLTALIDPRFLDLLYDDPNNTTDGHWNPLICSTLKSYPIITEMLLSINKINTNILYQIEATTPIMIAARNSCFEIVKLLYEYPETNINMMPSKHKLLSISAEIGDVQTIQYLLNMNHKIHDNLQKFDEKFIKKKYWEMNNEIYLRFLLYTIEGFHLEAFKLIYQDRKTELRSHLSIFSMIFLMAIQFKFMDCIKFLIQNEPDESFDTLIDLFDDILSEKIYPDIFEFVYKIFEDEKKKRKKII